MVQEYKHPLLSGKQCMVHVDFIQAMDLFCQYLKLCNCSVIINSSFREDSKSIKGAIVKPSKISNHFVGCAFDCNIIDKQGKVWTSEMLEAFAPESPQYNSKLNNEILTLINLIRRNETLRWGGDFHEYDTVHFDNGLNMSNKKRWNEIYAELHK